MRDVNVALKAVLERGAVWAFTPWRLSRRRQPLRLILAYHNVVPDCERMCGDRSLHLHRRAFAEQLDILLEHAHVVPLGDLLSDNPNKEGPRASITFDDAYFGAVTEGVAELRARSLPATIFVAPGCLGGQTFWWDALAGDNGLADAVRTTALDSYAGTGSLVLGWAREAALVEHEVPGYARSATIAELETAMGYSELWLGSHTWTHPNLTRLREANLSMELTRPLSWLRDRFGSRVGSWLAYPYGLVDTEVEKATSAAGYEAAFRVSGGWVPRRGANAVGLPRLNVPAGISADGFRLRLAGLFCE